MPKRPRRRFVTLQARLAALHPELDDPTGAITSGRVRVDGRIVTNPRSAVPHDAAIRVVGRLRPRGALKLQAALDTFTLDVRARIAADIGASTGGFTTALLEAGAARVYAVDAGHGQLLGSLRVDPRVVNLEGVNLGDLDHRHIPDVVDVITIDLAYLALAAAAPQLERLRLAATADLVALVKPMFELGLASPPDTVELLDTAVRHASLGLTATGWQIIATTPSPVTGRRGAIELLLHARRTHQPDSTRAFTRFE